MRQSHADVTATRDYDTANRFLEASHFTKENPNVLAIGNKEDFVTFLDDGFTVR